MPTEAPPDSALWQRNLVSLRRRCAEAAELLHSAALPDDLSTITARDGSPTLQWHDDDGRARQLGRTHMPRIRAEALIERFIPGQGNVALIGIGHGLEARLLLDRLGSAQAVFIIEPDAAAMSCALRLHDFSLDLESGRLLLFAGPDAWDDLERFFEQDDGYLPPDRTLHWPWFTPGDVADAVDRLARLSQSVEQARGAALAAIGPDDSHARTPAACLIACFDPFGSAPALVDGLARGFASAGGSVAAVSAGRASSRHPLRLARMLNRTDAEWLILVNALPEQLPIKRRGMPRVAVWLTDDAAATPDLAVALTNADRVIAALPSQAQALAAHGLEASRVRCVSVGADASPPLPDAPAMVDISADAAGIRQSSHVALWKAAAEAAAARSVPWSDDQAELLLKLGESRLGIRLQEDSIRDSFLQRIRLLLGPGAEINAYRAVWNSHFPERTEFESERAAGGGSVTSAAIREPDALIRPLLAIPAQGRLDANLLAAAAQGRPLLIRAHSGQTAPDGWAGILDPVRHVVTFSTPAELHALLNTFAEDPTPLWSRAAAARAHVLEHHTWGHRIAAALSDAT